MRKTMCPTCMGPATLTYRGAVRGTAIRLRSQIEHDCKCPMCGGPVDIIEGDMKCHYSAVASRLTA